MDSNFADTFIYLSILFLLGPIVYFLNKNNLSSEEIKKKLIIILPLSLTIILVLMTGIYGLSETLDRIEKAASSFIRGIVLLLIMGFIGCLGIAVVFFPFLNQKKQLLNNIKEFFIGNTNHDKRTTSEKDDK